MNAFNQKRVPINATTYKYIYVYASVPYTNKTRKYITRTIT